MSEKNLKEVLHSSNLVMKPFTRMVALAVLGYIGYVLVTPQKPIERIPPNYAEYRRQKGLPDIPIKHPGFVIKEMRIIPDDEFVDRTKN